MNMGCQNDAIVKKAKLLPSCVKFWLWAPLSLVEILLACCVKFLCSDFENDREILEGFQERASGKICCIKIVSVLVCPKQG